MVVYSLPTTEAQASVPFLVVQALYQDPAEYDVKIIGARSYQSERGKKSDPSSRGGALEIYLREIMDYPLLTLDEESDLARRYRDHGSLDAYQKLVCGNLRYVVRVAKKNVFPGVDLLDKIQAGNMGLLRAAKLFDPDQGVRLLTYAHLFIKHSINRFCHTRGTAVRFPVDHYELIPSASRAIAAHVKQYGEVPTEEQVWNALRGDISGTAVHRDGITALLYRLNGRQVIESLDDVVGNGDTRKKLDMVRDNTFSPEQSLIEADLHHAIREAVYSIRNPRLRHVMIRRFEFGATKDTPDKSHAIIGAEIGLTRGRVQQLEEEGIALVRRKVARKLGLDKWAKPEEES